MKSEILHNSHVMVVGCGALGNEVLKNLVLMGAGHLVIVDFDYVDQGNLTRSILFRKSDVGRKKVEVARETLLALNPYLDVKSIFGDIAYDVGLGLIRRMDVVIGCVDSRWARYCIQRLCHRAGKTWVDGGILDLTGTVKVFRPGETCYACSLSSEALADMQRRMPCSGVIRRREAAGHAPTTPIIASIIGAVQVQEAIFHIENELSQTCEMQWKIESSRMQRKRMFCYDGGSLTVQTPILEAWDDDCALHGEWKDSNTMKLVPIDLNEEVCTLTHISSTFVESHEKRSLLLNEPFVDYIIDRNTDERHEVMLPAHKVQDYIENHPVLGRHILSEFYQHEYREIDSTFPYPHLTFRDLGLPEEEILRLRLEKS